MIENEKNKKSVSWRAAEYEYHKKNKVWYISIVFIMVLLSIISLWQKNFFFLLFILIAGGLLIILGNNKPKILDFHIDENEIMIGQDIVYNYKKLEWFSIVINENSLNQIVIKTDSKINPILKIQADSNVSSKAKKILSNKLEEKEYEPSMIELISDFLKF